jgi:hypothetical protein
MEDAMFRRRVSLLILAVLLLGLPSTSRALGQAAPPTRHLQAVFSSTRSGVITDVIVDVTDGSDGAEAVIEVSRYRPTCANKGCPQVLLHAFNRVPLAAGALQISGELEAVTVQGSGPVDQPLVPGVGTVSIDLTWTGIGTVASDEHEEGELFRRARAAGVLRAGTTNFTPQLTLDASIEEW